MSAETELFNPFPGLRPFNTDEDHLFFGREQQISDLLTLLRKHRFVAVVGSSGSGKSSVVRAGLLPELLGGGMRQVGSDWQVAIMRPGGSPIVNLAETLCNEICRESEGSDARSHMVATLTRSSLGLVEGVQHSGLGRDANLLIVVDQFEELFRFQQASSANDETATAFVSLLLEATRQQEFPIYVIVTMRSDFLGESAQISGLAEVINDGQYLIPALNRDQLRTVIEGPVRVAGGRISNRLVQELLNAVGRHRDRLPVLQHALMRTWECWQADQAEDEPLDLRHYESAGGIHGALSLHADEIYEELSDDRLRLIAERLFMALTEAGPDNRGTRRPTRLDQLCEIVDATQEEVVTVIDAFRQQGRTFLMPMEPAELNSETVIDISHESLMRVWHRLKAWVEDEAQSARIYRRLAESARLCMRREGELLRGRELAVIQEWYDQRRPTAAWGDREAKGIFSLAQKFLQDSRRRHVTRRRLRVTWILTLSLLLVSMALSVWYTIVSQQQASLEAYLTRDHAFTLVDTICGPIARGETGGTPEFERIASNLERFLNDYIGVADSPISRLKRDSTTGRAYQLRAMVKYFYFNHIRGAEISLDNAISDISRAEKIFADICEVDNVASDQDLALCRLLKSRLLYDRFNIAADKKYAGLKETLRPVEAAIDYYDKLQDPSEWIWRAEAHHIRGEILLNYAWLYSNGGDVADQVVTLTDAESELTTSIELRESLRQIAQGQGSNEPVKAKLDYNLILRDLGRGYGYLGDVQMRLAQIKRLPDVENVVESFQKSLDYREEVAARDNNVEHQFQLARGYDNFGRLVIQCGDKYGGSSSSGEEPFAIHIAEEDIAEGIAIGKSLAEFDDWRYKWDIVRRHLLMAELYYFAAAETKTVESRNAYCRNVRKHVGNAQRYMEYDDSELSRYSRSVKNLVATSLMLDIQSQILIGQSASEPNLRNLGIVLKDLMKRVSHSGFSRVSTHDMFPVCVYLRASDSASYPLVLHQLRMRQGTSNHRIDRHFNSFFSTEDSTDGAMNR